MYEQYTDKQIVEMLVPKLEKLYPYYDWNDYLNDEGYETWLHFVATLYKSAYIRGQLGRSLIIGEKKGKADKTERWVTVNGDNIKKGDSVRYTNKKMHKNISEHYPAKDVVGKVVKVCSDCTCLIQWSNGSTSENDEWYAAWSNLEVLLCE